MALFAFGPKLKADELELVLSTGLVTPSVAAPPSPGRTLCVAEVAEVAALGCLKLNLVMLGDATATRASRSEPAPCLQVF